MYRIRIPAEYKGGKYFTRRMPSKQISSAYYELHIQNFSDLTVEEHKAILDKWSSIGGLGNLRVLKIDNDTNEGSKEN